MKIKQSIHHLPIKDEFYDDFEKYGYKLLNLSMLHIKNLSNLPLHHKDPFDRIIISQGLCEGLKIITSNKEFKKYDAKIILA